MEDENLNPSVADEISKLPVDVQIRLGSTSIPLSKFQKIKVGDTIVTDLHFPKATATSAGKAFAEVEILEIEGSMALKVCSVTEEN